MSGKALTKYVRISPRKARLAANLIRGRKVEEAVHQLSFSGLKAGRLLLKTLLSATANATQRGTERESALSVLEVHVDEGPRLKRAKPKNRGGRHPIWKRMSHFTVVVG